MTDNPLWVREVRARMRGAKAYLLLLSYALLLTLICAFVYLQWLDDHARSGQRFGTQAGFVAGRLLYQVLFGTQAVLIAIITPALTAGAITLEREQRTLEMVALTRLKSSEVVSGKLGSAVAFVALLLTSSLPLVSLAFFLGGVSPGELFFTYVTLLFAALFFGAVGIYCSALVPSTAAASVLALGAVGVFFLASLIAASGGMGNPLPFRSLNPIGAVTNVTTAETFFRGSVPSWLPAFLVLGLAALLTTNLAMARLEFYRDPRTGPIRLLATALWGFGFLHLIGHTLGSPGFRAANAGEVSTSLARLAGLDLALLLLLVPPHSARDRRAERERGADRSAFPILFAWLLIPFLFTAGGVAVMRPSQMPAAVATLFPALMVALAMTAAFVALGHALSAWLPSRGPAVGLAYALVAAALLLPYLALIDWRNAFDSGRVRPVWNLLYLTPFTGFSELADSIRFRESMPPTLARDTPFWQVTTGIYTLLAALLAGAALAWPKRPKNGAAG